MSVFQEIRNWILDRIRTDHRLTSHELALRCKRAFPLSSDIYRRAIFDLLSRGELKFTYLHGCSFLEISHDRPVRISDHIWIQPPRNPVAASAGTDVIAITIAPGAAFGLGDHATTRLALCLLDSALSPDARNRPHCMSTGLDIGTGSGILAIAMAMMGVDHVAAVDTDSCAAYEASENVRLNQLEDRIDVRVGGMDTWGRLCDCVTANLRLPTLLRLRDSIVRIMRPGGKLILSGIKSMEVDSVLSSYTRIAFEWERSQTQDDWSAVLLQKRFSEGCGRRSG